VASLLPGADPFGDLLAMQLGQNADTAMLQMLAGAVGVALGQADKVDPDKDKKALEAAELAIQLQLPTGPQQLDHVVPMIQSTAAQVTSDQPDAVGSSVAQAVVQEATTLEKFGEPGLPQRQVIAAGDAKFAVSENTESDMGGAKVTPSAEFAAARHLPDGNLVTAIAQSLPSDQRGLTVSQPAATLPTATIEAPVSSPAWNSGLGEKVVWMVNQQHQGIELHLNPPSLGPLEVRISMSDGQANLSFMSHHLPVREAIESATPRLREMLGESGISLGNVSVNNGSFAQQQSPGYPDGNDRPPSMNWQADNGSDMFPSTPTVTVRQLHANGMVDTFA